MNKKIERILAVASKNGVALHKNFTTNYLSTHGFYEGPQALAESTVDEMERLCFIGMNSGFDNNLKNAIEKLSGVVISLTAVKNGDLRELAKIDVQRGKISETVNKSNYPLRADMREPVRQYIDSSVEAIDTIASLNSEGEIFALVDKRQIEYLEESKQKLGMLSMALTTVMDAGSLKAKENAEKIIESLKKWRRDCSRFMMTSASLKHLDEAIKTAQCWNALAVAPNKKEKVKDIPAYVRDELSIIASSRSGLETLSVFNARIQTRLAEIDKMKSELTADKDKCAELRAELSGIDKKKKEVAIEFKNTGDAVKANREIALLRQRADELTAEIKGIEGNGRLLNREKDLRNRREIALNIKYICDLLIDNKSDLVFLARVIQHVDFNALVGLMTGRSVDTEEARESILQIRTRVDSLRQTYLESAETLRDEEEITNNILGEGLFEEETADIQLNENGLDPELAALLEDFNDNKTEENNETNEEIRRIVPLGDDDK